MLGPRGDPWTVYFSWVRVSVVIAIWSSAFHANRSITTDLCVRSSERPSCTVWTVPSLSNTRSRSKITVPAYASTHR
jgi:hypothetical protein